MRAEPTSKSEQVTQLIFGETYLVTQANAEATFVCIVVDYDEYTGWIEASRWYEISQSFYQKAKNDQQLMVNQRMATLDWVPYQLFLPLGATLPAYEQGRLAWENAEICFAGKPKSISEKPTRQAVIQTAFCYLGTPYLWGGKTIFGIDCSAFTQQVLKAEGYYLPRDAYQQAVLGEDLYEVKHTQNGDLAFFARKENVIHVGIVVSISEIQQLNNELAKVLINKLERLLNETLPEKPQTTQSYQWIIHAYDQVRIDVLDDTGIYNIDEKRYTHYTWSVKQIIEE